ncbi:hypothetical protein Lal_00016807 [Lupinus albus]|nr:hypothetical protein Lal_00016807 [Lupinus albus]
MMIELIPSTSKFNPKTILGTKVIRIIVEIEADAIIPMEEEGKCPIIVKEKEILVDSAPTVR